jgi:CBS domain-containing protein
MDLARNLRADPVTRLQPSPPISLRPDASIAEAVRLMRSRTAGCVLVCDGRKLLGIFTERDLLRRVYAVGRPTADPVSEVMTPHPVVVGARDPVRRALVRMEKGGYRHLPVVDDSGRPVGILSVKRIVHFLAEHFPTAVYNLPPDPDSYPHHRGGA